jgi:cobalt-zinc-cadmium resistance protein CzcA
MRRARLRTGDGIGDSGWRTIAHQAHAAAFGGEPDIGRGAGLSDPDGERLADEFARTVYLRTVQDWMVRPQIKGVPGVAGADAIGGYISPEQGEPLGFWDSG